MANEIKFTDGELKQINDLGIEVNGLFTQLGQLKFQVKQQTEEFERREIEIYEKQAKAAVVEEKLYKDLNAKYGDGIYNPATGIFTPTEKKEVETK